MKTIGLIGGMSWESTVTYYQIINRMMKQKLGGLHSAKIVMYSVDFQEIEHYQATGAWDKSAEVLTDAAKKLEIAGADFIVICSNTMHKVADTIQQQINLPILHIATVTAEQLLLKDIKKVALLGTKYTMEQDFYKQKLINKQIGVIVPEHADRDYINQIIYHELCKGEINIQAKKRFLEIIDLLARQGAQGIILGCTEIGLLVNQTDTDVPLFDTALIHAEQTALKAIDA